MKKVLIILILIFSTNTFACVCLHQNLNERYINTDFIATVRILDVAVDSERSNYLVLKLEISDLLKGKKINTIKLRKNKTMCNLFTPKGTSWLVFAKKDKNGILSFGYCSGAEQLDKELNPDNHPNISKYQKRNLKRKLLKLKALKAKDSIQHSRKY